MQSIAYMHSINKKGLLRALSSICQGVFHSLTAGSLDPEKRQSNITHKTNAMPEMSVNINFTQTVERMILKQ